MREQTEAALSMTETEVQALAWRLHLNLPLGWHVETVGNDPRPELGWFVEVRNNQHPYHVRLHGDDDVTRFYELHGAQHPVEFYTDSIILEFHPERVRIELAQPGQVAFKDVIELIEWGHQHLDFLKTLAARRVCCPTCGRTDCKLLRVEQGTGRYVWGCWDGHWFTTTYSYDDVEVLPGEPEPEPESDIPF